MSFLNWSPFKADFVRVYFDFAYNIFELLFTSIYDLNIDINNKNSKFI